MRVEEVLVVSVLERTVRQRNANLTPPIGLDKNERRAARRDLTPLLPMTYNYFIKI